MKLFKSLLLMFTAVFMLTACSGDEEGTKPGGGETTLIGSIWAGPYKPSPSQTSAVKIKSDSELLYDQCVGEDKAIQYVKTEKGSNNFFRIFTFVKEGDKFKITGVKNGKDNPNKLAVFYIENNKLIIKNSSDQIVVEADIKETANDAADKKYILDEINKLRQAQGIAPVQDKNDGIKEAARIRAQEIEKLFEHKRPDGRALDTILDEISVFKLYRPSKIGEIIAEYSTAKEAMEGWKKSEGHSKVLLDPEFTMASVGKNGRYWVVFFGKF